MTCDNYKKDFFETDDANWFQVAGAEWPLTPLCSPSCLVEWVWKRKEEQPKLSKSRMA